MSAARLPCPSAPGISTFRPAAAGAGAWEAQLASQADPQPQRRPGAQARLSQTWPPGTAWAGICHRGSRPCAAGRCSPRPSSCAALAARDAATGRNQQPPVLSPEHCRVIARAIESFPGGRDLWSGPRAARPVNNPGVDLCCVRRATISPPSRYDIDPKSLLVHYRDETDCYVIVLTAPDGGLGNRRELSRVAARTAVESCSERQIAIPPRSRRCWIWASP